MVDKSVRFPAPTFRGSHVAPALGPGGLSPFTSTTRQNAGSSLGAGVGNKRPGSAKKACQELFSIRIPRFSIEIPKFRQLTGVRPMASME